MSVIEAHQVVKRFGELTRLLCIGTSESHPGLNVSYLLLLTVGFGYLALWSMKRRLIK
jgi:hypothetical protein